MTIQIGALWLIVWFYDYEVTKHLWLLADMGYDFLAIYVFLGIGSRVYLKTFQETRELRAVILSLAVIVVSFGFILLIMIDLTSYFGQTPEWLSDLSDLGDILPMTGLLLFVITYVSNINYIYRLPNNNYILMVAYKNGLNIHSVRLKTNKNVVVEEQLLSGLLVAINNIFSTIFQSKRSIDSISGRDATILMESGKYITAIVLADKISTILDRALRRYVTVFEQKFEELLKREEANISLFNSATELLKPVFPFFVIESIANNSND